VIFLHPDDIRSRGFTDGQLVDIETHWPDDEVVRSVPAFRIVSYDTPVGSAAAYYPETSPLIPLDSTALESNTPTSKSVIVRLLPAGEGHARRVADASQDQTGSDWSHKWEPDVEEHLS